MTERRLDIVPFSQVTPDQFVSPKPNINYFESFGFKVPNLKKITLPITAVAVGLSLGCVDNDNYTDNRPVVAVTRTIPQNNISAFANSEKSKLATPYLTTFGKEDVPRVNEASKEEDTLSAGNYLGLGILVTAIGIGFLLKRRKN